MTSSFFHVAILIYMSVLTSKHLVGVPACLSSLRDSSISCIACIFVSLILISAIQFSINYLAVMLSTIQSLSRTVRSVEFPSQPLPDAKPLCITKRTRLYGWCQQNKFASLCVNHTLLWNILF